MPGADKPDAILVTVDAAGAPSLAGHRLFEGDLNALLNDFARSIPLSRARAVITPNVDQAISLRHDSDLRRAFDGSDTLIADGMPLVLLARAMGARRLRRLTGADLLPAAAARAGMAGWRIVLTGGRPEITDAAAARLSAEHGAQVFSVHFPMIRSSDDPASREVISELNRLRPDLVFVCLGSPKQDVWVHTWREELPPAIYIGAGAAVDFAAGVRTRAPKIFQRLGAEWLFRLLQEPRRLARRYALRGPEFLVIAAQSLAAHWRHGR